MEENDIVAQGTPNDRCTCTHRYDQHAPKGAGCEYCACDKFDPKYDVLDGAEEV